MLERYRMWEREEVTDLPPDGLRQWTRKEKVSRGLQFIGAVMTEHPDWIETPYASAQGQRVQEELVVRLLVPGSPCPVVEALPDVRGRFAELTNSPRLVGRVFPGEGAPTARLLLQETASYGSRQGEEHHARNLNVGVQSTT